MRVSRWILVGAVAAAVVILAGSSALEAGGLRQFPWTGPDSIYLQDRAWAPPGGLFRMDVNPYVETLAGLVSQYLVGVLVVVAAPRLVRRLANVLSGGSRTLARFLLTGILFAAALSAVALLSGFYVHTFLLPILLLFAFFMAALGGAVAMAYALGRGMLERAAWGGTSPLLSLGLGTLLIFAGTRIPYLGPFVLALVWLTGVGAALATRFGRGGQWSLAPLLEDRES
jgi:hypothetical protein